MELENQVCSLKQAKKLMELRVKADSYFVWLHGWPKNKPARIGWWLIARDDMIAYSITEQVNAYSSAEIGVMLPAKIKDDNCLCPLILSRDADGHVAEYSHPDNCLCPLILSRDADGHVAEYSYPVDNSCVIGAKSDYEAHAKADLLIRLLDRIMKPMLKLICSFAARSKNY